MDPPAPQGVPWEPPHLDQQDSADQTNSKRILRPMVKPHASWANRKVPQQPPPPLPPVPAPAPTAPAATVPEVPLPPLPSPSSVLSSAPPLQAAEGDHRAGSAPHKSQSLPVRDLDLDSRNLARRLPSSTQLSSTRSVTFDAIDERGPSTVPPRRSRQRASLTQPMRESSLSKILIDDVPVPAGRRARRKTRVPDELNELTIIQQRERWQDIVTANEESSSDESSSGEDVPNNGETSDNIPKIRKKSMSNFGKRLYSDFGAHRNTLLGGSRLTKNHIYRQLSQKNILKKSNYWAVVVAVALTIVTVCQVLGFILWDNDEINLPEGDDIVAAERGISPTNQITDRIFVRYVTIVLWTTTVITGLGAEVMMGSSILVLVAPGWGKIAWRYSQLVFSLFACVSIFAQSTFGLPFLVIGLWKGGFPETIGHFVFAHIIGRPTFLSVAHFLNGMAVLLHHSAAAFVTINTYTKLYPLSRPLLAIVIPLIVQHWFALMRYQYPNTYNVCLITMEIVFEWELFANIGLLSTDHHFDFTARGSALIMVFSHWLFITSGALEAIEPFFHVRAHGDLDWEHDERNPDAIECFNRSNDPVDFFGQGLHENDPEAGGDTKDSRDNQPRVEMVSMRDLGNASTQYAQSPRDAPSFSNIEADPPSPIMPMPDLNDVPTLARANTVSQWRHIMVADANNSALVEDSDGTCPIPPIAPPS